MTARDWDAAVYDRVSDPQYSWGVEVLDRVDLSGVGSALDAGCGSGRVTAELVQRLPGARVLACDASPSMVAAAREALPGTVEVFQCDLIDLELAEPVDLVFSTAVFHWIPDHERLFQRIHAVLRPGGRLVAQCGGFGNVANLREALATVTAEERFAPHVGGWPGPWNFQDPDSTRARLERAGFRDVGVGLERKDVHPPDRQAFLATVTLGNHLDRMPEALHESFVARVAAEMGEPFVVEYVRLKMEATR